MRLCYYSGLIGLLTVMNLTVFGQYLDDFTDGTFTQGIVWHGDTSLFIHQNGQISLNNAPITDQVFLSLNSLEFDLSDSIWLQMDIHLDLNPSSSNNFKLVLFSNNADLELASDKYYIQIGESGSTDNLKLYHQTSGITSLIAQSTSGLYGINPSFTLGVYFKSGEWSVYSDLQFNNELDLEFSVLEPIVGFYPHFGILCEHTSSNANNFSFDNFELTGTIVTDTIPPKLLSGWAISDSVIGLSFNEDIVFTDSSAFILNDSILTEPTIQSSDDTIIVQFSHSLETNEYNSIKAINISDDGGNISDLDSTSIFLLSPAIPSFRDVVINEIMADPFPSIGMPESDFIELLNVADYTVNLENWAISDAVSSTLLSENLLHPNEFLILADQDDSLLFNSYQNVLFIDLPAFNISGDSVSLTSSDSTVIDVVVYDESWYRIPNEGGVTLEQIQPHLGCNSKENWCASSNNLGGTPGFINSVSLNPPEEETLFTSANLVSPSIIEIQYSKTLDTSIAPTIQTNLSIDTSFFSSLFSFSLNLSTEIEKNEPHELSISEVHLCNGESRSDNFELIVTDSAIKGDVIINEVLFNPHPGEYDFLEIYNTSDKYLELSDIQISRKSGNTWETFYSEDDSYIMHPHSYYALSENPESISTFYPSAGPNIIYHDLPSMNDDEGWIGLLYMDSSILDEIYYNEDYHMSLIEINEGISLEKIDPNASGTDRNSWHSASSLDGWATPGMENSQLLAEVSTQNPIEISTNLITPNGDGDNDILSIHYKFGLPGYLATILIYDQNGQLIKKLAQNELLGISGNIKWDGTNDIYQGILYGNVFIHASFHHHERGTLQELFEVGVIPSQ